MTDTATKLFEKEPIEKTNFNEKSIGTKVLKEMDGPSQLKFLKDLQAITASHAKSAGLHDFTIDGISSPATMSAKGDSDKISGLPEAPRQPSEKTPLRKCTIGDLAGTVPRGACEPPKKPDGPEAPISPYVPSNKFGPSDNPRFQ